MTRTGDQGDVSGGRHAPDTGAQSYYARAADELAQRYESLTFEAVHEEILHLLPEAPVRAVDIGAGTGRDAAALAGRGHEVIAVEPVRQLRLVAQRLHADANVVWLEDSLPGLDGLDGEFGLILLSAVWMHLDERERAAAMGRLAELLAPDGLLVISLRHGPPPTDRRMFDVPTDETAALAQECGLSILHVGGGQDQLGRNEIHWSELALREERS
ncbi:class I SAM-dependent methyltransferase [Streptomyces sp. NPDC058320]|uniref:class I SAM-dependent methyltransferase n=1 Tax=unclassified Streptomyces TaxID=2593676 RepID=UPI0036425FC8